MRKGHFAAASRKSTLANFQRELFIDAGLKRNKEESKVECCSEEPGAEKSFHKTSGDRLMTELILFLARFVADRSLESCSARVPWQDSL